MSCTEDEMENHAEKAHTDFFSSDESYKVHNGNTYIFQITLGNCNAMTLLIPLGYIYSAHATTYIRYVYTMLEQKGMPIGVFL